VATNTGISPDQIEIKVAEMQARGEIANIPPPQLDPIIAAYRSTLENLPV